MQKIINNILARSKWKLFLFNRRTKLIIHTNLKKKKFITLFVKTFSSNTYLPTIKRKLCYYIHAGHYWRRVFFNNFMRGRYLGELRFTRKFYQYFPKKNLKKKNWDSLVCLLQIN